MQPTVVPTAVSVADNLTPNQVLAFLAVIAVLVMLNMVWRAWTVFLRRGLIPPKLPSTQKRRNRRKVQRKAPARERPREPRQ
jgi:hypothetical protein